MHGNQTFRLPGDLYLARDSIIFEKEKFLFTLLMLPGVIKKISSLSMNGPLWTISYEFWLYGLAALLAYGRQHKSLKAFLCLTIFCAFQI
jgi:peptidoglycan/LPS O-acetylase OafA/YrhL